MTAAELLGEVLARARATTERSPEQVGEQTGVHGRTIRRLEDGESERPRRTTLEALARFYGLDGDLLLRLAMWSSQGVGGVTLRRRLMDIAEAELGVGALDALVPAEDEGSEQGEREFLVAATMRLARARPGRSAQYGSGRKSFVSHALNQPGSGLALSAAEQEELSQLVVALAGLDRRRRRLAMEVVGELRRAQQAERMLRRPRDVAAHGRADPLFDAQSLTGQQSLPVASDEE